MDANAELREASKEGDVERVRRILEEGRADVDAREETLGWTALHFASEGGHTDVVKMLLEAKCDVNATDEDGRTALDRASYSGKIHVVKLLLEANCDVNATNKYGSTALHRASWSGHTDVVKLLLEAKCDVNATDEEGRTALHEASERGRIDVVKMLVEAKCDVNATDECDVNAQAKNGWTALHLATESARVDVVDLLLGFECDINRLDKSNHAAFHVALLKIPVESLKKRELDASTMRVLQTLVVHGASWDTKCDEMTDSGEVIDDAPALKICFRAWEEERKNGLRLTDVPYEVVKQGAEATLIYLRESLKSEEVTYRIKVSVVGASNWGKTSLTKSVTSSIPSIEHAADRTIGIEHTTMRFEVPNPGENKIYVYEVTFSDFAGQDAYQVAHSLFFSYRTVFLLCVDLQSYAAALTQVEMLADTDAQVDRYMDEFVDTKIFKWIRIILARQPDAEFVFVATKADVLDQKPSRIEEARVDLMRRLRQYVDDSARVVDQAMAAEQQLSSRFGASMMRRMRHYADKVAKVVPFAPSRVHRVTTEPKTVATKPGSDEWMSHQHSILHLSLQRLLAQNWLQVSCRGVAEVVDAQEQIKSVIRRSNRAFAMPESYTRVLERILEMRKKLNSGSRVDQNFVIVGELCKALVDRVDRLDVPTCMTILRILHTLGDVLWYEDLGIEQLKTVVIINPMLLIDFIRQIVNHNHGGEAISHLKLKRLPFWIDLDVNMMLVMKLLLQEFHLVLPSKGEMEWDSDLIVPAFWRSKSSATWVFGGQPLSLDPRRLPTHEVEAIRVCWEYHFVSALPEPIFDQLIVASYSRLATRNAGPDWILYEKKDVFACRVIITRDSTTKERVVRLEAVARADLPELWIHFKRVCSSLERVLSGFKGLIVTRHVLDDQDEAFRLEDVINEWVETNPEDRLPCSWLPPDLSWYRNARSAARC